MINEEDMTFIIENFIEDLKKRNVSNKDVVVLLASLVTSTLLNGNATMESAELLCRAVLCTYSECIKESQTPITNMEEDGSIQ